MIRAAGSRRGSSATEFAILLPVLLLLTFGIFDYGWYFVVYQQAYTAARQGARVGAQTLQDDPNGPVVNAQNAAENYVANNFPLSSMTGTANVALLGGTVVGVTLQVNFTPLLGYVPTPSSFTVRAERQLEDL